MDRPKSHFIRWFLFAPAAVIAFLLVGLAAIIIRHSTTTTPIRGDEPVSPLASAVAVFVSAYVAVAVSPAHRAKVAVAWVTLILLIACYGNFINGPPLFTAATQVRTVLVITLGAILGCAAALRLGGKTR
jgi:hypothetical protein